MSQMKTLNILRAHSMQTVWVQLYHFSAFCQMYRLHESRFASSNDRNTLFSRYERSSEEQLQSLRQSMDDSSLVPCGSDDKECVILTPEIEFDSLSTCDSKSAYEVFNLCAFEVLSLYKNFPDRQSTLLSVRDEDVKDENNPYDAVESPDEPAGYVYHQNSEMLLGKCDNDRSYCVDIERCYHVKGQQIGDKNIQSHDQCKCQHCGRTFFSAVSFRRDLKIDHTELNELRCISCNDTFESISDLQFHKSVHSRNTGSDGPFLCSMCGKTFGTLSTLRSHERRVHQSHENSTQDSDMKHTCEECGKEFQFQEYLKRHMLKHGEKNFVCETCGRRSETLYTLKLHQESHSEVRPYGCKICGSSYKRYRNLLSH